MKQATDLKEIHFKTLIIDRDTGELVEKMEPGSRPGRYEIQQCFKDVPSMTDQAGINENNLNHLMQKYKPDELALFLHAKNGHKKPLLDHDFSLEPDLQTAKNIAYAITEDFKNLPLNIQQMFGFKPTEFLAFADNPQNEKQLEAWGLKKPDNPAPTNASNANEEPKEVAKPQA